MISKYFWWATCSLASSWQATGIKSTLIINMQDFFLALTINCNNNYWNVGSDKNHNFRAMLNWICWSKLDWLVRNYQVTYLVRPRNFVIFYKLSNSSLISIGLYLKKKKKFRWENIIIYKKRFFNVFASCTWIFCGLLI